MLPHLCEGKTIKGLSVLGHTSHRPAYQTRLSINYYQNIICWHNVMCSTDFKSKETNIDGYCYYLNKIIFCLICSLLFSFQFGTDQIINNIKFSTFFIKLTFWIFFCIKVKQQFWIIRKWKYLDSCFQHHKKPINTNHKRNNKTIRGFVHVHCY